MAAGIVKLTHNEETKRFESNEKFLLEEATGKVAMNPGEMDGGNKERENVNYWRMIYAPDQKSRPRTTT